MPWNHPNHRMTQRRSTPRPPRTRHFSWRTFGNLSCVQLANTLSVGFLHRSSGRARSFAPPSSLTPSPHRSPCPAKKPSTSMTIDTSTTAAVTAVLDVRTSTGRLDTETATALEAHARAGGSRAARPRAGRRARRTHWRAPRVASSLPHTEWFVTLADRPEAVRLDGEVPITTALLTLDPFDPATCTEIAATTSVRFRHHPTIVVRPGRRDAWSRSEWPTVGSVDVHNTLGPFVRRLLRPDLPCVVGHAARGPRRRRRRLRAVRRHGLPARPRSHRDRRPRASSPPPTTRRTDSTPRRSTSRSCAVTTVGHLARCRRRCRHRDRRHSSGPPRRTRAGTAPCRQARRGREADVSHRGRRRPADQDGERSRSCHLGASEPTMGHRLAGDPSPHRPWRPRRACSTSRPSSAASNTRVGPGTPRTRSRAAPSTTGVRTTSTGSSSTTASAPRKVLCSAHTRVWHDTTNVDQLSVWMQWADGREATFRQSDVCAIRRPKFHIEGTAGTLEGQYEPVRQDAVLAGQRLSGDGVAPRRAPGRPHTRPLRRRPRHHRVDRCKPAPHPGWGFHRNLADHLLLDEPLAVRPEQSRDVVSVLEAAHRSGANGGELVELPVSATSSRRLRCHRGQLVRRQRSGAAGDPPGTERHVWWRRRLEAVMFPIAWADDRRRLLRSRARASRRRGRLHSTPERHAPGVDREGRGRGQARACARSPWHRIRRPHERWPQPAPTPA